ncbi:orotidine 5'-phosphate decarboxylase [Loktanella sp. F6476L]|uniref:orotidine 5'-phosphate decarboxylase n=1 Tax=Loktanella sp. F6476L TaxID=2926405 RepID=UPI001FF0E590|nr:orotidine 5'-phosphate decarboxylase [Loktanella sp. F6476L]MCK0121082.1 orotidine 5'-phosphate decarboxylase [Loktanella sp. F6476L]UWQ99914.1 orotidine 5'-phosphate decarboxylase [Rhodobacteraceae bacterium S2214]
MNISLGDVRYNATAGAFEARVDIARGTSTFRYPCSVAGPVTMDMDQVRDGLKRRAMRMSDTSPDLMSHI